jgi:PAS domain S-box-containing protein
MLNPAAFAILLLLSTATHAAERVSLQLRWLHGFQFAGYYMAKEKGFYRDAGLDVALLEGGPEVDHIGRVIAGQADYGVAGSPLIIEYMKGKPVRAMAAVFQHSPYAIMARESSGITTPQHMIGKSVYLGIMPRTAEIQAMLIQEGVTLDKLTILSQLPRDLDDPEIDAFSVYLTNEPFLWRQQGIAATIIRPQSYGIDFYGDVLFSTVAGLRDEDRAQRFLNASIKGWRYAFDHPDETVSVIAREYNSKGRSRSHLRYEHAAMIPLVEPAHIPIGQQNPYRWERIGKIYESLGMAPATIDFSDFIHDPARDRARRLERQTRTAVAVVSTAVIAALLLWLWNKSLRQALILKTASLREEIRRHSSTQQDLERTLAKYKTLFSAFPHGITVADDDGNIIEANRVSERLLGVAQADHVARRLDGTEWRVVRPDGSSMPSDEWPAVAALRERRTVADVEQGICRPDGRVVWLSVTAAPLPVSGYGVVVTYSDITERKKAQQALRQTTSMLLRTEAIARIGSWQWEVEEDLVIWSDELFRIFGLAPAVTAPTFAEHHHLYFPEDMLRLRSAVERAVDAAEPYELDLRAIRSDGATRYCRAAGFAERDATGKVFRLYGFLQDNTELFLAQQETKKLVYDQSAILDNVPAYIYFKDRNNNIIRISDSVARITGRPKHEIEGRHSSEIYPEMADAYWSDDLEVITTGKPKIGIVESLPLTNGGARWLQTDKVPYVGESGKVEGVIVIATDITERINAEKGLQEAKEHLEELVAERTRALAESERSFRNLAECVPTEFERVDLDGRYTFVNRTFENWFDIPACEVVGKHLAEVLGASAYDVIAEHVETVLSGERVSFEAEVPYLRGGTRWVRADYVPDADDAGNQTGFIALITDITSTKQAQSALLDLMEANRRLSRRILAVQEEERRFLARELHDELDGNLSAMMSYIRLVHAGCRCDDSKLLITMEEMRRVCARSLDLLREIGERLRPQVLDRLGLADAIKDLVSQWRLRLSSVVGQVECVGEVDDLGEDINITVYRIVQEGLANIERHARATRASVRLERLDNRVELSIRDNGVGMDAGRSKRGLGLLGMRERVEALDGTFDVQSSPGEGMAVVVSIPCTRDGS